jgi:hypothetical protein
VSATPTHDLNRPPLLPSDAPPVPRALTEALAFAADAPEGEHDGLRHAVCEYTRVMRVAGLPPERVVIAMKAIAVKGIIGPRVDEQAHLLERIVTWCIAEYYRAD